MNDMKCSLSVVSAIVDLLSKLGLASIFRPMLTRAQANADAYENIITALANVAGDRIEANLGEPMMLEALISCGGKTNLENMARILLQAVPQLTDRARPDLISDDWAANWRDKARTCSDPDVSKLWAHLLASEANELGSFSRKTVNVLADMEPGDAQLFQQLSNFRIVHDPHLFSGTQPTKEDGKHSQQSKLVVLDETDLIYDEAGVTFESLARLEWLGLVRHSDTGYSMVLGTDKFVPYEYGGGYFLISHSQPIYTGKYDFTPAGAELARLCTPLESRPEFGEYLANFWQRQSVRMARTLDDFKRYGLVDG